MHCITTMIETNQITARIAGPARPARRQLRGIFDYEAKREAPRGKLSRELESPTVWDAPASAPAARRGPPTPNASSPPAPEISDSLNGATRGWNWLRPKRRGHSRRAADDGSSRRELNSRCSQQMDGRRSRTSRPAPAAAGRWTGPKMLLRMYLPLVRNKGLEDQTAQRRRSGGHQRAPPSRRGLPCLQLAPDRIGVHRLVLKSPFIPDNPPPRSFTSSVRLARVRRHREINPAGLRDRRVPRLRAPA